MKKLKILHVNEVSNVTNSLVNGLRSQEVEVCFESIYNTTNGLSQKTSYFLRLFRAIVLQIKYIKFDIIHIHYMGNALFFLFYPKKLVVHLHGTDIRGPLNIIRRCLKWIVLRRANGIMYSTPDIANEITQYLHKAKYIPNPIKREIIEQQIALSSNEPRTIFYFSALSRIKGGKIGITALKIVKEKYPNLNIRVLGFGDQLDELDLHGFTILSRLSREVVLGEVKAADIVLGQLYVGAIGMSELEVLALGKPLITNFIYNDIYEAVMPIYHASTVDGVVQSMSKIIENWNLETTKSADRKQWVEINHSEESVGKKLFEIYRKII